jgi:aryl-alcohol dehydrogenase-like predicted oxidoreductase
MDFFDTARYYSDSEEKIGNALCDVRKNVVIATKAMAPTREGVASSLSLSLEKLKTDYVDILQLHNPDPLPDARDPDGAYAGLVEARERGQARFIGVSCHRLSNALLAVQSGHYDTVQFPLKTARRQAHTRGIRQIHSEKPTRSRGVCQTLSVFTIWRETSMNGPVIGKGRIRGPAW